MHKIYWDRDLIIAADVRKKRNIRPRGDRSLDDTINELGHVKRSVVGTSDAF